MGAGGQSSKKGYISKEKLNEKKNHARKVNLKNILCWPTKVIQGKCLLNEKIFMQLKNSTPNNFSNGPPLMTTSIAPTF